MTQCDYENDLAGIDFDEEFDDEKEEE